MFQLMLVVGIAAAMAVAWQVARGVLRPAPRPADHGRRDAPPPTPPPRTVIETTTVVLRRQIPPGPGAPRSWLGGLPCLPDDVAWPRGVNPEKPDAGPVPLHFVAQLCCADLPPELWGGLGPREGWLLWFVNGNACGLDDPGTWRLLHTREPGRERPPPADLGPIHDGVYTGWTRWSRTESRWPRWPLDLVAMPNTLHADGPRAVAAPPDLEERLYPGAPVDGDRARLPKLPVYSRRVLARGLRALAASWSTPIPPPDPALCARFLSAENLASLRAAARREGERAAEGARARLRDAGVSPDALEAEVRKHLAGHADHQRRVAEAAAVEALIERHPDAASLLRHLDDAHAAVDAWRAATVDDLSRRAAAVEAGPLDVPLDPEEAAWLEALFATPPQRRRVLRREGRIGDLPAHIGAPEVVHAIGEAARAAMADAAADLMASCYLDPALRSLLPSAAIPAWEAYWRALRDHRPHRMGGFHDGVQSDAVDGPTSSVLLLQLATDDAMPFCWGDAGAIYVFLAVDALERAAFDRAEVSLESH